MAINQSSIKKKSDVTIRNIYQNIIPTQTQLKYVEKGVVF